MRNNLYAEQKKREHGPLLLAGTHRVVGPKHNFFPNPLAALGVRGLATGDRRSAHRIPWRKKAMARRPLRSVASSPWRSASRAAAGSWASVRSRRGRRRSNNRSISLGVGPTRARGAARAREERGSDRTEAGVSAREVEEARNARTDPRTRSPARRSVPIPRGSDPAPTRRRPGAPTADRTPRGTPP